MNATDDHQSHDVVTIPVSAIRVLPGHRKLKEATVEALAGSIEADGCLQPIGVRPGDGNDGGFLLVFGGHRLEAHRRLGRITIEAKVLEIDAGDAEAVMHAENLFRSELDRNERYSAIAAWTAHYKAKHPESYGKAAMVRATRERHSGSAAAAEPGSEAATAGDETARSSAETPRPDRPAKALAKLTGKGETVSATAIRVAENLTAEQRSILIDREVTDDRMNKIARISDPGRRAEAVSLIESGTDAEAAICIATAPAGATVETVANPDVEGYKSESEMSDDEWFNFYCGDTASRLPMVAFYKADAILWRKIQDARIDFTNRTRRALGQSKVGIRGFFHYTVCQVVNVDHPSVWPACARCGGTGNSGDVGRCPNCRGQGFLISTLGAFKRSA